MQHAAFTPPFLAPVASRALPRPNRPRARPATGPARAPLRAPPVTAKVGGGAKGKAKGKGEEKKVDFAAEGIEDEVPLDLAEQEMRLEVAAEAAKAEAGVGVVERVVPREDIRFGVEDDLDPFKRGKVGEIFAVTADGGVAKTIRELGDSGLAVANGDSVSVHYTGRLAETSKMFDSSEGRAPFEFTVGAGTVIKGWDLALPTMSVGDSATISVSPKYAYGRRGVPPVIPPNATLDFDVQVVAVTKAAPLDPAEAADIDLNDATAAVAATVKGEEAARAATPRTPDEIANAYNKRLAAKKGEKKKALWERFYFISPFASQTGEKPPWWLNPNITFSIVAVVVAAAFYVVLKSGGVHQGYVEEQDVNMLKGIINN